MKGYKEAKAAKRCGVSGHKEEFVVSRVKYDPLTGDSLGMQPEMQGSVEALNRQITELQETLEDLQELRADIELLETKEVFEARRQKAIEEALQSLHSGGDPAKK